MTKEDNDNFESSSKCWVCDNDYTDDDVKVRDHCHITGKYRVPSQRDCNTNIKLSHKTQVVFSNLKNYDSHLIMINFKINVIPNGLEKYMRFSINNKLSFIDSYQFLSFSLDNLVKNLGKNDFKYLSKEFNNNVLDLVKQKRFYTPEYMGDFEKFEEQLPSKEKFYSLLRVKKISDKENDYVRKVRNKFQKKTMKDYCVLYLKCDALLLVDVFEKFRNNSLKNYGLCRSHCLSAPDLSWDAMLKMTKVELQVITDSDMYICFKKGMRGGVSYISNRYSKISKKYLKSYDPKHESKHTIY